jgi:DNA-binding CsgD family transcriptional regulator
MAGESAAHEFVSVKRITLETISRLTIRGGDRSDCCPLSGAIGGHGEGDMTMAGIAVRGRSDDDIGGPALPPSPQATAGSHLSAASSAAVLDSLTHGVVITDRASRPLLVNRAAREIIAAADGLRIDSVGLGAVLARETGALRWIIAGVSSADGAARAMRVSRPAPRRALMVLVAPMRVAEAADGQAAIVFVSDPEHTGSIPSAFLQQAYGLTPTEAAVAIEIARGEGLRSVVAKLGISRSTARTHLQRTFDKTGTRRQAKLAWLIAESCAGLRLDADLLGKDPALPHPSTD